MEQDKKSFVHDTIDLDEIRELLGENVEDLAEEDLLPVDAEPLQELQEDVLPELEEGFEAEATAVEESESEEAPQAAAEETEVVSAEPEAADEVQPEEDTPKKKKGSFLYELYGMLHDVIYLLAAVTLVFVFVVRLVGVQGDSMLPTLHNRDYLVLESNFLYGSNDLEYGDVVVLNVPHYQHNGEGPIVKRVIATEGQTVDIDFETGVVYVDGVRLVEDYINAPTFLNWEGEFAMEYPVTVPEGCIFVLGDNRNNSMDSRYAPIGMVDEQYVLGKVLLIVLPGQTTDDLGNVIGPREWGRIGLVS